MDKKNNNNYLKGLRTTFKSDKNDFIKSETWRVFRIMSEFVDGFEALSRIKKGISFFH